MFGVLVIKDTEGKLGYLAAFSGNLAGSNHHAFFVPPVYDLLQPDGFFRIEEAEISGINHRIAAMEASEAYCSAREEWKKAEEEAQATLASEKQKLKEAKTLREQRRKEGVSPEEAEAMSRESQFQKAEFKRLERRLKEKSTERPERLFRHSSKRFRPCATNGKPVRRLSRCVCSPSSACSTHEGK